MGKKKGHFFYAVAWGLRPGVYSSWEEAEANLGMGTGIPIKQKKFMTWHEAATFVEEHHVVQPVVDPSMSITKYFGPTPSTKPQSTEENLETTGSNVDSNQLNMEPTESTLENAITQLNLLTPDPESDLDSSSNRDDVSLARSVPQLVRIVELVSLPDEDPEWEWDTGDSSGSEDNSREIIEEIRKSQGESVRVTAKNLLREYKINCEQAEGLALNYVSEDLQHPVISCFREVTKADINNLFGSGKLKKGFTNLELAIVCIGVLDLVAISIDNPLYNETNKVLEKHVPGIVEKIMTELKGIIRLWGMSDDPNMQKRVDIILSYVRNITKLFQPVEYAKSFEATIINLEGDIRGRDTEDSKKQPSPLFELKINKNIFEDLTEEQAAFGGYNRPKEKSRIVCDKTPSPPAFPVKKPASISSQTNLKPKRSFKPLDSKPSSTKRNSSSADDVVILGTVMQPTKKTKIEPPPSTPAPTPVPSNNSGEVKAKCPPKNAFAIMMAQSRHLAEQNRLRKLAQEQNRI